ncbi:hypothetical protein CPJCM30710_29730 [Clostridium polyendosporum]|uniref:Cell envelope-related transcriptional attenuator domain-containing protein n=1 Tax=Clostridium polyendosporum TaxID=69208 RepID=A0A919S200_9CLOT|nr:LCP family protein [Clostridium polyendosporum]GIM30307.1 hypothetical protein CPJCM30710_29730 [Clostridium polyendosporum]
MNNNIKQRIKISIISVITLLILIISGLIGGYTYIKSKIFSEAKVQFEEKSDLFEEEKIEQKIEAEIEDEIEEKIPYEQQKGIINILLIGTDARSLNEKARSDTIMIATIDSNHKKVKVSSIMRDSYVEIKGCGENKINSAYAFGGPELLLDTIYRNFNIKIDKYIVVNFWGFEDIIDEIGGIDIDIKSYEISEINKYTGELRDVKSPKLIKEGFQHVDGQQALAYSRIRKVGNGSFERSERQRIIVTEITKKILALNPIQYPLIMNKILPYVKTNIEPIMIMNYGYTVYKLDEIKFEQLQIPVTELCEGRIYNGAWVFLMDRKQNSKVLNDFIYIDKPVDTQEFDYNNFRAVINQYLSKEKHLKISKHKSLK